jgi:hypothetical protein
MHDVTRLPQALTSNFATLIAKVQDFEFHEAFSGDGDFVRRQHDGRAYWYYRSSGAADRNVYVGPASSAGLDDRVRRHRAGLLDCSGRLELGESLKNAGLPQPTRDEGNAIASMSRAGIFRLRCVLVGSVAYQSYAGLLGADLPSTSIRTEDVDIALDFGISRQLSDSPIDVLTALRSSDASFIPRPNFSDPHLMTKFANDSGFLVEFLTTHRGSDEHSGRSSKLPSLGPYMGAVPLRYLDFLIVQPVTSLLLHGSGLAVTVPDPARYAVHKLIVAASRRVGNPKIAKDLAQSAELIVALAEGKCLTRLRNVWREAYQRGPTWRSKLIVSAERLDPMIAEIVTENI